MFLTKASQKAHSHSTQRLRLRWSGAKRQVRLVTLFRQTTLSIESIHLNLVKALYSKPFSLATVSILEQPPKRETLPITVIGKVVKKPPSTVS